MIIQRARVKGFTLVELIVVTAIIAILAAVAIPAYQDSVRKGRRSDAKVTLLNIAQALERCFSQNSAYTTAAGCAPYNNTTSEQGYYTIAAVQNASTFSLTATPKVGGPQVEDTHCASFSITQANAKTATNSDCW